MQKKWHLDDRAFLRHPQCLIASPHFSTLVTMNVYWLPATTIFRFVKKRLCKKNGTWMIVHSCVILSALLPRLISRLW